MSSGEVCVSCGAPRLEDAPYCSACGQRRLEGRHTLGSFGRSAIARVVGEKGIIRTAVQLAIRPGRAIRDYLAGKTARYTNPVGLLLVAAAVFALVVRAVSGPTGAPDSDRLWAILVIPFVAAASRLFHWRGSYNFAEHLIVVTYLSAQVLVLLTVLYFGMLFVPSRLEPRYAVVVLAAGVAFYLWGYSQVFEKQRVLAALTGLLSLVLGSAVWMAILVSLVRLLRARAAP